eukprot:jgi/Bigna1/144169/aug1.85_g18877
MFLGPSSSSTRYLRKIRMDVFPSIHSHAQFLAEVLPSSSPPGTALTRSTANVLAWFGCMQMQVLNAQTAGAIGIIVGGGSGNNDLLRMGCNADYCNNITIPAVYVTETTVAAIKETFAPRLATVNAVSSDV